MWSGWYLIVVRMCGCDDFEFRLSNGIEMERIVGWDET